MSCLLFLHVISFITVNRPTDSTKMWSDLNFYVELFSLLYSGIASNQPTGNSRIPFCIYWNWNTFCVCISHLIPLSTFHQLSLVLVYLVFRNLCSIYFFLMLNFYSLFFLFSTDFHLFFAFTSSIHSPHFILLHFVSMYSMTMINVDFIIDWLCFDCLCLHFAQFIFLLLAHHLQFANYNSSVFVFFFPICIWINANQCIHHLWIILFKRNIFGEVCEESKQFIVKNSIFREIYAPCQTSNYDKREYY